MGCCYNKPNTTRTAQTNLAALTGTERKSIRQLISTIPVSQRHSIQRIPSRYLLTAYGFCQNAQDLLTHERYIEAGVACDNALTMFLEYVHPTHYIIQEIMGTYADSCLGREQFQKALDSTFICIAVHSSVSPADRASLSPTENFKIIKYYFQLGFIFTKLNDMENALKYMLQARQMISSWPQTEDIVSFTRMIDDNIRHLREPKVTVRSVHPRPGEIDIDVQRQLILEVAQVNAQLGSLQFDVSEFTRLPAKETEYFITPTILGEVYKCLYNELSTDGSMANMTRLAMCTQYIAAQIKNSISELKQNTSLTPMLIEAALTIIIDKQDKYYHKLTSELGFEISYTDNSSFHQKGVRVFQIRHLKTSSRY